MSISQRSRNYQVASTEQAVDEPQELHEQEEHQFETEYDFFPENDDQEANFYLATNETQTG